MRKYIAIAFFMVLIAACSTEKLDEIDTDPNNPLQVTIKLLMPTVTSGVPYYTNGTDLAWYSSVFCEYTTGTYLDMRNADRRQNINSQLSENAWLNLYTVVLKDMRDIIEKGSVGGTEEGKWKHVGIAQVLMAYTMAVTTDIWGRVPYSEALKGDALRQPAYDRQEAIYADLQKMLNEAIVHLDKKSTVDPGEEDLIFNGNTTKWIAVAWALKAKLFLHLTNVSTTAVDSALACLDKAFTSADDEFTFSQFGSYGDVSHQNPWYRESRERGQLSVSKTYYDLLQVNNDPRMYYFFTSTNVAPNGTAQEDPSGNIYAKLSTNVLYPNAPIPLLSYEELKFIEAECKFRKGLLDGANKAYQDGVYAALLRYGISAGDVAPASNPIFYNNVLKKEPSDITLNLIITQKYIAMFPYGAIEAFNDWRRTSIPTLNNPLGNPPRRFPYPQNEISSNGTHVPSVNTTDGVWWDDGSED